MKPKYRFLFFLLFSHCVAMTQTRNFKLVKVPVENPTKQQRKAVVIGMSDYGDGRALNNTLNDANDMSAALASLGFEVTLLRNNDLRNLKANLTKWYSTIEGNDMAVFYFAGHGMEVNGENYLIPVDAEMGSESDVAYSALNVHQILANMDERKIGMKLIILDACRDNPFKRSWSRSAGSQGLAQLNAPRGTYIAFAASPGSTAADGGTYKLNNGVFTHYLKQEILKKGVSIEEIFTNVTNKVAELTNDQQTPFRNSSLRKVFYFSPASEEAAADTRREPEIKKESKNPKLRQAEDFYRYNQNHKAIAVYKSMSQEELDADAKFILGSIYQHLSDSANSWDADNSSEAGSWFEKSARDGNDEAMIITGSRYQNGINVHQDNVQARSWYLKAADAGNVEAFNCLGNLYIAGGYGLIRDYVKARAWFQKAIDNDSPAGMYNMALMFENGQGVKKDYIQAKSWHQKAAAKGYEKSIDRLDNWKH